jgi:hypothetical protein
MMRSQDGMESIDKDKKEKKLLMEMFIARVTRPEKGPERENVLIGVCRDVIKWWCSSLPPIVDILGIELCSILS